MIEEDRTFNKLTGIYRGKVVDTTPGRVKVYIPSVHDEAWEKDTAKLPPAEQIDPIIGAPPANTRLRSGSPASGSGTRSVPALNSWVPVFFLNGDQNYPCYFGVFQDDTSKAVAGRISTELTDSGLRQTSLLIQEGDSVLRLSEDGSISLEGSGAYVKFLNGNIQIKGKNIDISSEGGLKMTSGALLDLEGENVTTTSSGSFFVTSVSGNVEIKTTGKDRRIELRTPAQESRVG